MTLTEYVNARGIVWAGLTSAQKAAYAEQYIRENAAADVPPPAPSYASGFKEVYGTTPQAILGRIGEVVGLSFDAMKIVAVGALALGGLVLYRYVKGR